MLPCPMNTKSRRGELVGCNSTSEVCSHNANKSDSYLLATLFQFPLFSFFYCFFFLSLPLFPLPLLPSIPPCLFSSPSLHLSWPPHYFNPPSFSSPPLVSPLSFSPPHFISPASPSHLLPSSLPPLLLISSPPSSLLPLLLTSSLRPSWYHPAPSHLSFPGVRGSSNSRSKK